MGPNCGMDSLPARFFPLPPAYRLAGSTCNSWRRTDRSRYNRNLKSPALETKTGSPGASVCTIRRILIIHSLDDGSCCHDVTQWATTFVIIDCRRLRWTVAGQNKFLVYRRQSFHLHVQRALTHQGFLSIEEFR